MADHIITLDKGIANGVATLDATGKIPAAQVPAIDSTTISTAPIPPSLVWRPLPGCRKVYKGKSRR